MNYFCHNCGSKQQVKSNFCGQCGCDLSSLSAKPKPKVATRPFVANIMDGDDDDDDYIDRIQHLDVKISELAFEITKPREFKETIASVVQQQGASQEGQRPQPYLNVDNTTFLAEFSKEAGAK